MNFIHSIPLVISSGNVIIFKLICPRFQFHFPPPNTPGFVGSWFPDQRLNLGLAMKALSPNHWTAREFP